ncbi:MAG: rRNA pseudouridine synthase [Alphaproteobacteria bacterium]|nr:rRNA pseudouridine synthase [Alphaproteobacteria bacterium]
MTDTFAENKSRSAHPNGDKIAKILATHGLCSRREAERWIEAGRVSVGGIALLDCSVRVKDLDQVRVDGNPLPSKPETRLWLYYKPVGIITSHKDPEGRPTLFDQVRDLGDHIISVGRLDLTSEGLILLTNQGELARTLELPSTRIKRTYRVRLFGQLTPPMLEIIDRGLEIDGVHYQGASVSVDRTENSYQWITMTLAEGKNREIRRIIEHFGGQVTRLIRTHYGPFCLNEMEPDDCVEVAKESLERLLDALKLRENA